LSLQDEKMGLAVKNYFYAGGQTAGSVEGMNGRMRSPEVFARCCLGMKMNLPTYRIEIIKFYCRASEFVTLFL